MIVPKCAPWTPVSVTWEDCKIDPTGQHLDVREALGSYKPCIRKTLGHWVGVVEKDGRSAVILATEDDRTDSSGFGGIIQVPLGMVMEVEVLKGAGKKKWITESARKPRRARRA